MEVPLNQFHSSEALQQDFANRFGILMDLKRRESVGNYNTNAISYPFGIYGLFKEGNPEGEG